ncbi:MAG: tRNA uridine-5-carboxymethylaminomethyl(34) synthesis GTPase MnmE [Candidatus Sumerlaeota bacterium]|nr:tRNA uridine-5-carboxymethylaminomethyl(34) synthesis GTPase MnmE [Candidatus Sumerlaeota bacterium]
MPEADTIIAPATTPGRSAIALIRLSGPGARAVVERVFRPKRAGRPWKPWAVRTGEIADPAGGGAIDRSMAVWMPGPGSYTGEDVVELSCHGSPAIVESVLRLCLREGARLAEPGEFTRRAFLNGKMDLAEAEAVCDLIASETEASLATARRQLAGELSQRVSAIRETLLDLSAEMEARIDFPEEDIPPDDAQRFLDSLESARGEIQSLLEQGRRGRRLREGARVAIVGRVNVGKSSLFNALIRMERAISTPHPGTTRDTIEARIDLRGVAVDLVDTAGIRSPESEIEGLGIERSKREIERADAVVWVLDRSQAVGAEDREAFDLVRGKPFIIALNKSDLTPGLSGFEEFQSFPAVATSAVTRRGVDQLEKRLWERLAGASGGAMGEGALVSNVRHIEALEEARAALGDARALLERREGLEFVMVDLRSAVDRIGAILGLDVGEEILDRIFQRFCIGK